MCGIAGYFQLYEKKPPDGQLLRNMINIIRYRGPDEFGAFLDDRCTLGQARLSIIDLEGGSQPLCNEDETIWITFNGEIFNYIELRQELEKLGHRFRTKSDTEVIVHGYEEWGNGCLQKFNGQFAFAIYNRKVKTLFLARDRLGIRPIFYATHNGRFYFASEIKAILCDQTIPRKVDLRGLAEIFTWWTTAPPRTAFENINELAAGSFIEVKNGDIRTERYWRLDFPESFDNKRSVESWAEELHALLVDAVRLRLRADVPVGAYLSGGLDSSAATSMIRHFTDTRVETFSIAFHDKAYDESEYQNRMAAFLKTNHHQVKCSWNDIAENFPDVIWHTERPILRTAPTPLYMLSELVRANGFKVVMTGEGADEMFGGYDIFKETLIRKFWAKNPDSQWRPALLKKLYPTLPLSGARAKFYLETFYKSGLSEIDRFYFSHIPRINTTTKIMDYFTGDVKASLDGYDAVPAFGKDLPGAFNRWHHLTRAQYLEAISLLSCYLLSSQGDRVSAANSVEGRYPFLDHRVAEFASSIPPWHKILGLKEKFILKKAMRSELPPEITERVKQPYMAPDSNSFTQADSPAYVDEIFSESAISRNGLFDPVYAARLKAKCARLSHAHLSFKDNMSFIGILSTELFMDKFIEHFDICPPADRNRFKVWVEKGD